MITTTDSNFHLSQYHERPRSRSVSHIIPPMPVETVIGLGRDRWRLYEALSALTPQEFEQMVAATVAWLDARKGYDPYRTAVLTERWLQGIHWYHQQLEERATAADAAHDYRMMMEEAA